jgi:hypothetical protein
VATSLVAFLKAQWRIARIFHKGIDALVRMWIGEGLESVVGYLEFVDEVDASSLRA